MIGRISTVPLLAAEMRRDTNGFVKILGFD